MTSPITPRYALVETNADGSPCISLLACLDCEAEFTWHWNQQGRPLYRSPYASAGGWRLARQRNADRPAGFPVLALCPCPIGRQLAEHNPRLPALPPNYPPSRAILETFLGLAENPHDWSDQRTIRATNQAERQGFESRLRAHVAKLTAPPTAADDGGLPF